MSIHLTRYVLRAQGTRPGASKGMYEYIFNSLCPQSLRRKKLVQFLSNEPASSIGVSAGLAIVANFFGILGILVQFYVFSNFILVFWSSTNKIQLFYKKHLIFKAKPMFSIEKLDFTKQHNIFSQKTNKTFVLYQKTKMKVWKT